MTSSRYQAYPEYRDSGVEWLGQIPDHWTIERLRNLGQFSASGIDKKIQPGEPLIRIVNYTDVYGNERGVIDESFDLMVVSCPDSKRIDHQLIRGDLLFTPSSETVEDIGISCLVDAELENTAFSYHLIRLQFSREIAHGFKKYLTNNEFVLNQFSRVARGTTRQTLGRDDFKSANVPLPTRFEQTQIAKFLDHETAKIDRLIEKQRELIALLKEKRQAVNRFAKVLLIATSLSPLLGAVAVNKWANHEPWWWCWLLATGGLAFCCWGLLHHLSQSLGKNTFTVKEFESQDKEVLVFLLTYLLPFLSSDKLSFTGEWLTGLYIVAIILISLMHADAFHFNPVMGLLGYHFYAVKGSDGLSYMLITKDEIRRPGAELRTVALSHNIKLHVKDQ